MEKMTLKLYAILFLGLFSMGARCQEVALKSNLLYDAFATLNAGVETGLANRWTLDVSANYNGWTLSHDRKWKHWLLQPEARYWYSWILDKHWNLEAEIGFGYIYTRFDAYPCANCGTKLEKDKPHHYVGPTKAAVNLVYTF